VWSGLLAFSEWLTHLPVGVELRGGCATIAVEHDERGIGSVLVLRSPPGGLAVWPLVVASMVTVRRCLRNAHGAAIVTVDFSHSGGVAVSGDCRLLAYGLLAIRRVCSCLFVALGLHAGHAESSVCRRCVPCNTNRVLSLDAACYDNHDDVHAVGRRRSASILLAEFLPIRPASFSN